MNAPLMIKYFVLLLAGLCTAACGSWVTRYDRGPTISLAVSTDPNQSESVQAKLVQWAESNSFEHVLQDKSAHTLGGFTLMMRREDFAVHCTNMGNPSDLRIFIYKARRARIRPTNDAAKEIAQQLAMVLQTVDGVTAVRTTFEDRDSIQD